MISLKKILFCFSVFFFSLFATAFLNQSPIFSIALTLACISFSALRQPIALLGILLVTRMSLDHLSENTFLTVGKDISLSLSQMLGVFLLLASIAIFILHNKKLVRFVLWKPFSLLIGMNIILTPWSMSPLTSVQEIARLISIFSISFLAFISVTSLKDVKKVLYLLLLSGIIPMLEATRQAFFGIGLSDNVVGIPRIYGTFAHPNALAIFLYSLSVIVVLIYFLKENLSLTTQKNSAIDALEIFWLPVILLSSMALLILTYTRVAWIALFLFLLALALWRYRALILPLIIIPIILLVALPSVQNRVLESFQTSADSSVSWREGIWSDVTAKLRMDGKQYFGVGPDTFSMYAEKIRGIQFGSTDSHNDFVKFFVEDGWLGLSIFIMYLTLLAQEIRKLFTLPKPYKDIAIVFSFYASTILIASLSDNIYKNTPIQWVFFILFGTFLGLKNILMDKESLSKIA